MYQFILLIHVFAAALIVVLVLIQQGKGAAMGAAFGSGASQTVFGSRGSGSFMFRVTMSLIIIFFVTSIGLNYLAAHAYKQAQAAAQPIQQIQQQVPVPAKTSNGGLPSSVGSLPSLPVNEIPVRK
jgi:preprotein translocase subunit SecG